MEDLALINVGDFDYRFFLFAVTDFFLVARDGDVFGPVVKNEASVSEPIEQIFWCKVIGVDEPHAAANKPDSNAA